MYPMGNIGLARCALFCTVRFAQFPAEVPRTVWSHIWSVRASIAVNGIVLRKSRTQSYCVVVMMPR